MIKGLYLVYFLWQVHEKLKGLFVIKHLIKFL